MAIGYQLQDRSAVTRWESHVWVDRRDDVGDTVHVDGGAFMVVQEDGDSLIVKHASGREYRVSKIEAVVFAQDILTKYLAQVTIVREP